MRSSPSVLVKAGIGRYAGRLHAALLITLSCTVAIGQVNYATDMVNPFVGTGGHGHTFPGACVPNGLVQLSPDTRTDGTMDWDGCGGYHYSDSLIYGFSHTHLSGTGVADLCDVLLMPMSDTYSSDPVKYGSRFSHDTESAHAGYYRVRLDDPQTDAELTTTAHCGVHRYSMPAGKEQFVVLDLRHRDKLIRSSINVTSAVELTGERRSSSWAKDQRLFFCIRSSRPFAVVPGTADSTKAVIAVKSESAPLILKVGISAVSIEGARANIDAEVPGWDFDAVRKQAEAAWNQKLGKVEVQGGTPEQQRIFYTALYHCYVAPYIFNDVDGKYRGMDGQVHHADHNVYTVFSLWDTFRALHPLMTILEPEMTSDFIKTFLLHYQQGGRLPVWELWGNETDCMIGYHSASVIADAYLKGIRDFDANLALEAMMASANRNEPGLNAYREKGFISSEDESDDVSKTLEYSFDDACIAAMAEEGRRIPSWDKASSDRLDSIARAFNVRNLNAMNLFDPQTGFFRARRNGGFAPNFDPFEVNFHYTEANAWQYSLFVPQNIERLISAHGGREKFEAHLDSLFAAKNTTSGREQADITGLIGQYAQGNEPSHHMAYLYNRIGKPEKTRALVKRVMEEFYHDAPDGLIGNEDCGQMSAWYVLSALGLYPVSPGIDDRYEIGYPLFDQASLHLGSDKVWSTIVGKDELQRASMPQDTTEMVQRTVFHVRHAQLLEGGSVFFDALNHSPRPVYRPMSELPIELDGAYRTKWPVVRVAPVIQAKAPTFTGELEVQVIGEGRCTVRSDTTVKECPMNKPFILERTSDVQVYWDPHYAPVTGHFTKIDGSRTIKLESTYANQYAAGGDQALVDGLRGGPDFRTGEWQGFQGQDVLATIDLGAVMKVKRAGLSVLQDQRSWIWFPSEVVFAFSANGRQWSSVSVTNTVSRGTPDAMTAEITTAAVTHKARYVKIIAKNAGPCPDWHPGKGGATWIFADEVLIEAE